MALEALENETKQFIIHVIGYSLELFNLDDGIKENHTVHKNFTRKTVTEKYDYIKQCVLLFGSAFK